MSMTANVVVGHSPPTCQRPSSPRSRCPVRHCCPLRPATQLKLIARISPADLGAASVPGRVCRACSRPHLGQSTRSLLARPSQTPRRSHCSSCHSRKNCRIHLQQPTTPSSLASHIGVVVGLHTRQRAVHPGSVLFRSITPPVGRSLLWLRVTHG
jgi:hypothetical protein